MIALPKEVMSQASDHADGKNSLEKISMATCCWQQGISAEFALRRIA
jgi:hypothetical protein